jgi:hypothetical protein
MTMSFGFASAWFGQEIKNPKFICRRRSLGQYALRARPAFPTLPAPLQLFARTWALLASLDSLLAAQRCHTDLLLLPMLLLYSPMPPKTCRSQHTPNTWKTDLY